MAKKKEEKVSLIKPTPSKVGLVNRADYNVVITFTNGNSLILAPKQKTNKEFIKSDLLSANGKPILTSTEVLIF